MPPYSETDFNNLWKSSLRIRRRSVTNSGKKRKSKRFNDWNGIGGGGLSSIRTADLYFLCSADEKGFSLLAGVFRLQDFWCRGAAGEIYQRLPD